MSSQSRKPTNLSLGTAFLTEAKALKVHLSRAAEEGGRTSAAIARAEQWKAANAAALKSSNFYVERHGLPLDRFLPF